MPRVWLAICACRWPIGAMTCPIVAANEVMRDLDLRKLVFDLFNPGVELVDHAPDMAQILEDTIVGFVSHRFSLANSKSRHHPVMTSAMLRTGRDHCQTSLVWPWCAPSKGP